MSEPFSPEFPATLQSVTTLSPTVKQFTLLCTDDHYQREAGQWIHVARKIDSTVHANSFSVVSAPRTPGHIELAIKTSVRQPLIRWLHESAKPGDTVTISNGQGSFCYRASMGLRVVLLAAGTGITPFVSILRHIASEVPDAQATLVYSVASRDECLYCEELQQLCDGKRLRFLPTLTQPDHNWHGHTGRIGIDLLRQAGLDPHSLYYLCGPQEMVDGISTLLLQHGIPEQQVVFEKWW